MHSTLDVILAILQEAGVANYKLTDDGFHHAVELRDWYEGTRGMCEYFPVKFLCDFEGNIWGGAFKPTSVLVHCCSATDCCDKSLVPQNGSAHGVLEDQKFYNYIVNVAKDWKLKKGIRA